MTRDEHIRKAEEYLRDAERSFLSSVDRATAEATIGLLHLAFAAQKPIVTLVAGPDPTEAVREALKRMEADR